MYSQIIRSRTRFACMLLLLFSITFVIFAAIFDAKAEVSNEDWQIIYSDSKNINHNPAIAGDGISLEFPGYDPFWSEELSGAAFCFLPEQSGEYHFKFTISEADYSRDNGADGRAFVAFFSENWLYTGEGVSYYLEPEGGSFEFTEFLEGSQNYYVYFYVFVNENSHIYGIVDKYVEVFSDDATEPNTNALTEPTVEPNTEQPTTTTTTTQAPTTTTTQATTATTTTTQVPTTTTTTAQVPTTTTTTTQVPTATTGTTQAPTTTTQPPITTTAAIQPTTTTSTTQSITTTTTTTQTPPTTTTTQVPTATTNTTKTPTTTTTTTQVPTTTTTTTQKALTTTTTTTQETTTEHIHTYAKTVTPSTCKTHGFTTFSCGCGASYTDSYTLPSSSHDYAPWQVTRPATEREEGERTRTCRACDMKQTEVIPKTLHIHNYTLEKTTPSTCTVRGYSTYVCSCGDSYNYDFQPVIDHIYGGWQTVQEPTCTVAGVEQSRCLCGDTVTRPSAPKIHVYGDWEIITSATEKNIGLRRRICEFCERAEEEDIPRLTTAPTAATTPAPPTLPSAPSETTTTSSATTSTTTTSTTTTTTSTTTTTTSTATTTTSTKLTTSPPSTQQLPSTPTTKTTAEIPVSQVSETPPPTTPPTESSTKLTTTLEPRTEIVTTKTNTVTKTPIKSKQISLSKTHYTATGKERKPKVTVTDAKGNILKNGRDYNLAYSKGRVKVGTYSVTVKMTGNYSGKVVKKFKIVPQKVGGLKASQKKPTSLKLSWKKQSGVDGYQIFDTKQKKRIATVKGENSRLIKKLNPGKSYYYKVRSYKKVGDKVYYGGWSKTIAANTIPKTPKISSAVSDKRGKVLVKWNKQTSGSGYELQYSTNSKFKKNALTKTVKKNTVTAASVKNLPSGKKYYVRVRAFRTINGKRVYGSYSNVRSVVVKK